MRWLFTHTRGSLLHQPERILNLVRLRGRSKAFNNLQAVGESVAALGWVTIDKTPGPYVSDSWESGDFYAMRILKEFKGTNEDQCTYAKSLKQLYVSLQAYIKEHHRTGLSWNPKGVALAGAPSPARRLRTPSSPGK